MNSKGMSQTLALIVAASVLMMTALTVIMLMSGSLTGFGRTTTTQACLRSVQTQCGATGAQQITIPGSCLTNNNNLIQGYPRSQYPVVSGSGASRQISCTKK